MLIFIIPVIHPEKCSNYRKVSNILNNTLFSVCNQLDPDFRVIVVCNKKPDLTINNDKIEIIEVDFPLPPSPTCLDDRHSHVYRDKGSKVLVGLLNAAKYKPTHYMVMDHDDFVSNKLSGYIKNNPKHNGWFFSEGYVYSNITKIIALKKNFQSYCGTSHIIRSDLLTTHDNIQTNPSYNIIQNNIDNYYLLKILGNHNDHLKYFAEKGTPLSPLPFIGSIWNLDTGDNCSLMLFNNARSGPIWGADVSRNISDEFGLPLSKRTITEIIFLTLYRMKNIAGRLIKH